jgi:hypothetical protein
MCLDLLTDSQPMRLGIVMRRHPAGLGSGVDGRADASLHPATDHHSPMNLDVVDALPALEGSRDGVHAGWLAMIAFDGGDAVRLAGAQLRFEDHRTVGSTLPDGAENRWTTSMLDVAASPGDSRPQTGDSHRTSGSGVGTHPACRAAKRSPTPWSTTGVRRLHTGTETASSDELGAVSNGERRPEPAAG